MPCKESFPRQDKPYGSASSERHHIFMLDLQTGGFKEKTRLCDAVGGINWCGLHPFYSMLQFIS